MILILATLLPQLSYALAVNFIDESSLFSKWIEHDYVLTDGDSSVTFDGVSFDTVTGQLQNAFISHDSGNGLGVCGQHDLIVSASSTRCESFSNVGLLSLGRALGPKDALLMEFSETMDGRATVLGNTNYRNAFAGSFTAWYGRGTTPTLLGLTPESLSQAFNSVAVRERSGGPLTFQYIDADEPYDWLLIGYEPTEQSTDYFLASLQTTSAVAVVPLPTSQTLLISGLLLYFVGSIRMRRPAAKTTKAS